MDEAVEMAINNNPSVRAANAQTQQAQALQNLPYNLGTIEVSYQGDGLFRENGQRVNQIGVVQNIPNPAKTKAQNNFQNQQVAQSILRKKLTEKELALEVRQSYLALQQRKELIPLYQQMVQTYERYLQIAEVRAEAGESNRIESLSLQSALNEYKLRLNQTKAEMSNLEKQLATLLNTNDAITSTDTLLVISSDLVDSTNNFRVQLANQNIQIEQANIDLLRAQMKPDFNLGYAVQNYFEDGWLHGLQAGVQIPLFNKQTKQKITAQKLQVNVAQANLEVERLRSKQQLLSVKNTIQLYAAGTKYYQEQLKILNPELERISNLNYQAGEISYIELLSTLKLMANNNEKYWEQVLFHNQAVVLYQFLSNQ